MAGTKQLTPFGLYDLAIKAPADSGVGANNGFIDVPGANQAQYRASVAEVEQTGDDQRLGVFYHTQKGTITCKASILATAILEKISGGSVSSAATTNPLAVSGTADVLYFQTPRELTPPYISIRATINGRRPDGSAGTMTAYWFRTTCHTAFETTPDAAFAKLDEVTLTFEAFASSVDENNTALPVGVGTAFGRIEVN